MIRALLISSTSSLFEMPIQPSEHFVVPLDIVGRLQDPVVFVGEEHETALDPLALQGGEGGQTL
jgi:hypothetical protein